MTASATRRAEPRCSEPPRECWRPDRGAPTEAPKQPTMPAWLFEFLLNVIGLPENDVLDMTEDEAMQRYLRHVGVQ